MMKFNLFKRKNSSISAPSSTENVEESLTRSSNGPTSDDNKHGFECNICFDNVNEPVLSLCGHLYCWSCIYLWMKRQGEASSCPVCKAGISSSQVIPVYTRGVSGQKTDPRTKTGTNIEENEPSSSSSNGTTATSPNITQEETIPQRPAQVRPPVSNLNPHRRGSMTLLDQLYDLFTSTPQPFHFQLHPYGSFPFQQFLYGNTEFNVPWIALLLSLFIPNYLNNFERLNRRRIVVNYANDVWRVLLFLCIGLMMIIILLLL